MSGTENETTTTNETQTLTTDELRDTVGDEIDARMEARGLTTDRLAKLDMLDKLLPDIDGLFGKHKPTANSDNSGLLTEISNLIDSKLSALTSGGGNSGGSGSGTTETGRKLGPLGRFLSGHSS